MKTYEDAIREAAETYEALRTAYEALRIVEKLSICNDEFRGMRNMIAFVYGKDAATVRADIEALLK